MSRSRHSRSFSRRSRKISTAGSATKGAAKARCGCAANLAFPLTAIAPVAQHRGRDFVVPGMIGLTVAIRGRFHGAAFRRVSRPAHVSVA
jgi:hypothetical protein